MNRLALVAGLSWLALVAGAIAPVAAQPSFNRGPGYSTPRYSPYLNLARGGNPGLNYYGLVRPEVDFRNAGVRIQQEITQLQTAQSSVVSGEVNPNLPTTGHQASFMNYSHFYPGARGNQVPAQRVAPAPSRGPGGPPGRR